MKAKKFQKKLVLNKKTITNLRGGEMKRIQGGGFTKDLECESIFFCLTEEYTACATRCYACP